MPNITLQQLKAFQAIMRSGSVSDAARELNRTQPAITASIQTLERQLGLTLFSRSGHRVQPTAEARYLSERCKDILGSLDHTLDSLVRFRDQLQGELKIACMPAASQILIPQALAEFLQQRPSVKLSFLSQPSSAIEQLIASQQFDLGLCETPATSSELFRSLDVSLPCYLACHKDSDLAQQPRIRVQSLADSPYIGVISEDRINHELKTVLHQHGLQLNQKIELQTMIPAFTFVEANMGYMVVDPLSAESYRAMSPKGSIEFRKPPFPLSYSVSLLLPRYREQSLLSQVLTEQLQQLLVSLQEKAEAELTAMN